MEIETYKWDYTFEYEMKLDKLKELGNKVGRFVVVIRLLQVQDSS